MAEGLTSERFREEGLWLERARAASNVNCFSDRGTRLPNKRGIRCKKFWFNQERTMYSEEPQARGNRVHSHRLKDKLHLLLNFSTVSWRAWQPQKLLFAVALTTIRGRDSRAFSRTSARLRRCSRQKHQSMTLRPGTTPNHCLH
jgi:hypothetical protein